MADPPQEDSRLGRRLSQQIVERGPHRPGTVPRRAVCRERELPPRAVGEDERRVLRLQLQAQARSGKPEPLRRGAGREMRVDPLQARFGDDREMRGTAKPRQQIEFEPRRPRCPRRTGS
jgi:hypothetical protein